MVVGVDGRSLTAAAPRGVSAYTAGMLGALARARADVEWRVSLPAGVARPTGAPDADNVFAVRHRAGSRVIHGAGALAGRPRLDLLLGRPDVLWLPAPAPVALDGGAPLVLSLHDLAWLERPADFTAYERLWHRAARPRALARRAHRIAAVSKATARTAERMWQLDPAKVAIVPAGPGDPGPPPSAAAVEATRARHGRYFLFVGALEPRKGLHTLLAAHARARSRGLDVDLVLAGDGRLRPALAGPRVTVLGRVSQEAKAALYAGALAVVLPAWLEGYGYPPLEAYAHGVPAIVTEPLADTAGPGAVTVPPGDAGALAAAMRALSDDPDRRAELARAGKATLPGRTWRASAARLWEEIESAARMGGSDRAS